MRRLRVAAGILRDPRGRVLITIGFQILIVGLLADLISANRRLIEDTLLRVKKIELRSKE